MKKDGHTYQSIPKQESKKHKYGGRVGSKACMTKKLYKPKNIPIQTEKHTIRKTYLKQSQQLLKTVQLQLLH